MSRVRWLALLSCLVGALRLHPRRLRQQRRRAGTASSSHRAPGNRPDDLLEPPASGHFEGAVRGGYRRREGRAEDRGQQVGKYTIKYVSLDDSPRGTREPPTRPRPRRTRARRSRTRRRSSTSASSTPAAPRCRCRSSTRQHPADLAGEHLRGADDGTSRARSRASRTSTTRRRSAPTRGSSRRTTSRPRRWCRDEGGWLQVRPHLERQHHVRRRPGAQHRAGPRGADQRPGTTAPTATRRTTGRSPPRSTPTASCARA